MSMIYQYDVPDVVCGNCSGTVEEALRQSHFFTGQLFGVDPTVKPAKLTITFEDDHLSYQEVRDLLNEVIEPVGFTCVEISAAIREKVFNPWFSHRMQGAIGIGVGALFLLLSFMTGMLPAWVMAISTVLSIPLTLFLGAESYQKAWKKLKARTLTMDTLFSISTITILIVSTASLFFTALPMMCEASLLIFGFRHIGLAVEHAFKQKNAKSQRFQDDAPQQVMRFYQGKKSLAPLESIQKNDQLFLSEGSILPVDGIFEESEGLVSDRIVTGSSMPRRVVAGEQLYAGSILTETKRPLLFRATSSAALSHLARLDIKIARAKLEKSALETVTNRILQYFIPTVICIAAISGIVIGAFFSPTLAIQCAVSVLVSACPCTLGLITPLAIRIGIKKAADSGVVFNSAKKLEATDNIQCVVFDLNGTLTQGIPRVSHYRALLDSGLAHDELLSLFAHFEKSCTHPVARAITHAARAKKMSAVTSEVTIVATDHAGRVIEWEGQRYVLGSEALMLQQGIDKLAIERIRKSANPQEGDSVVYLARSNQLIGYVVLHDLLRDDATHVISALKTMGKQPYLCTGADEKTALQYAKKLGISPEHVRANCVSHAPAASAQSKKNVLDELRKKGFRVAAVGDGGNDAEMIAAADVGFAISSGGDAHTQQQASAVIQGHSLLPVLHAFSIAKRTVSNIKENLMFSLVYNIATVVITGGLLLTLGVVLNPAVGALLMIIQTSLILLNVSRFAKQNTIVDKTLIPKMQKNEVQQGSPVNVMSLLLETPKPIAPEPKALLKKTPQNIDSVVNKDLSFMSPKPKVILLNEAIPQVLTPMA